MDFNKVNEANKAGENTPAASNINTDKPVSYTHLEIISNILEAGFVELLKNKILCILLIVEKYKINW